MCGAGRSPIILMQPRARPIVKMSDAWSRLKAMTKGQLRVEANEHGVDEAVIEQWSDDDVTNDEFIEYIIAKVKQDAAASNDVPLDGPADSAANAVAGSVEAASGASQHDQAGAAGAEAKTMPVAAASDESAFTGGTSPHCHEPVCI